MILAASDAAEDGSRAVAEAMMEPMAPPEDEVAVGDWPFAIFWMACWPRAEVFKVSTL